MRQVLIGSGFAARVAGMNLVTVMDEEIDAATANYRLIRIRCTEARTGPGGPGDLSWAGGDTMKARKWMLLAGVAVALAAALVLVPAVLAQGPAGGYGPGDGSGPIVGGTFGPGHGRGPGNGSGPVGGAFRMGGPANSLVAVAAEALGLERTELVAELQAGKTIAQVAEEQGVALEAIVDAFLAPREEHLAELVANGQLTQEEADALLATMRANVTARLNQVWLPQGRGPGTPGTNFVDEDGDGVCDYLSTGRMGRHGGRYGRWGR